VPKLIRFLSPVVAAALCATLAACRHVDDAPAVATVTVTPARPRVAVGSPLDLTYRFEVARDADISGDFKVFVHAIGSDGQMLWADDHEPVTPTSRWKPGETIEYTRTSFVPSMARAGEVTIEIGLYRENERLPLRTQAGAGAAAPSPGRSYRVASVEVLPETENVVLIYKSGWNPDEFSSDDSTISWKWTQKTAILAFKNPHADSMFFLDYDGRPEVFDRPQQLTVLVNDQPMATWPVDSAETTLRRLPIPAAAFGPGDMTEIRLEVDRTFVPARLPAGGKDMRDLGIRVYHAYLGSR
jgi:hypothetical protein